MTAESVGLKAATQRLRNAVNALEAAIDRRLAEDVALDRLKAATDAMADDRAQLAARLEDAEHRSARLGRTNRAVADRIDAAIDTIRSLLDAHRPSGTA